MARCVALYLAPLVSTMRHISALSLFALKLALTALPLWLIASRVDLAAALALLSRIDGLYASVALVLALTQIVLAGMRLATITRMMGEGVRLAPALSVTWVGTFFSQALVSFISGDVARVWLLARDGGGARRAANAVLLDRALGVIAIVLFILVGMTTLLPALPSHEMRWGAAVTTAGFVCGIAVFLLLGWVAACRSDGSLPLLQAPRLAWIGDCASAARHIFSAPGRAALALVHSLAIQALSIVSIFLLFRGMGATPSLTACFVFVPLIMLLAMLPISVAGWGVREGAMIVGFSTLAIASETTLAVSLAFGLILLVTSLPGAVLWLLVRNRQSMAAPSS